MITPANITAATANPAAPDIPVLERAFNAFALYPAGEGLSGFAGVPDMVRAFTDGVCVNLVGDWNQVPDAVYQALLAVPNRGYLLQPTYRESARMAVASWACFRDRFATGS